MNAALIGTSSGLAIILLFTLLKKFDKKIIYGLILACIGFLYVGYTWSDVTLFIINCLQAAFFLFFAYFGITRSINFLIAGYFLHGAWDFLFSYFVSTPLMPPHYDWFCLTIDWVISFYLLMIKNQLKGDSNT
ncbi:MAG: hypothetical protein CV087_22470 [Candidatus Brocadia sp. WS118]|nr:MAG: hypothetical protein CV087_22470 [Candidatus Brocadia sp. WS118]